MKNVKLFCEMAMYIKTIKVCSVEIGGMFDLHPSKYCCFIGNIYRSNIGDFTQEEAYQLSSSSENKMWENFFGMNPPHELLFPEKKIINTEHRVTGTANYDECVELLKTHKVLSVLRRMENQAKAA